MAMRRRRIRRPIPTGLADIGPGERVNWNVNGPIIGDGPGEWPSWQEWAEVYEGCRQEILDGIKARREAQMRHPTLARQLEGKPLKVPACERIYQAMQRGEDPQKVQAEIAREAEADDPRKMLGREETPWPR